MWFTYILYSESIDKYYVGHTDDLNWRLERHNSGWGKFTKRGIPWTLAYTEEFQKKYESIKGSNLSTTSGDAPALLHIFDKCLRRI